MHSIKRQSCTGQTLHPIYKWACLAGHKSSLSREVYLAGLVIKKNIQRLRVLGRHINGDRHNNLIGVERQQQLVRRCRKQSDSPVTQAVHQTVTGAFFKRSKYCKFNTRLLQCSREDSLERKRDRQVFKQRSVAAVKCDEDCSPDAKATTDSTGPKTEQRNW